MTKFQQEENSLVQKGKNFEIKIEKLLTDTNIKCKITGGPGDKGIDIKGMKKGVKFIIECKNWRTKNIDRNIINQIEGVFSRQSNGTIGIVAAPSMNRYTLGAKETARTSIYNVILVDVNNIVIELNEIINKYYITQIYYFYYCPTISAPSVSSPVVSPSSRVVSGVSGNSKSRGETGQGETSRRETGRGETDRGETGREEASREEASRGETSREEASRGEPKPSRGEPTGLLCGPGDKGIDIKGMKKGVKFIIECKNWRTKNIDRNIINQIEGVFSRQSNGTIGIVAAPSMNRYTLGAKETARTSIYNVILVDVNNIVIELNEIINKYYITQIYYFYYCPTISAPSVSSPVVSPSSRVVSGVSGNSKSRGETGQGETSRRETGRGETDRGETGREEASREEASRGETSREEASRGEPKPSRGEPSRGEKTRPLNIRVAQILNNLGFGTPKCTNY
ncbi:hypothetical protein Glove_461g18 [Diversispora epigaea]|uniref:Restriction endonuclease type IV Mrr domain-containing protein n=1 Tax=Diversispora epigaea TaxID=1348612 RepID=A0A397GRX9_9GLOM|nr:hypothetical protein Glove_461g18 [Diversispora epigaea]